MGRRDQGGKRKTQKLRLPVNTGIRADTFAEDVPLMDINNFVLTPDGTAICPRPGFEIRRQTIIGQDSDRKKIYFLSDPPDIGGGDLIVIVNNKNGDLRVELTEVVRSAGDTDSRVFSPSTFRTRGLSTAETVLNLVTASDGYTYGSVGFVRDGDRSGYASFRIRSIAGGTAVEGVDYTGFDYTVLWPPTDNADPINDYGYIKFPVDPTGQPTAKTIQFQIDTFSYGSGFVVGLNYPTFFGAMSVTALRQGSDLTP